MTERQSDLLQLKNLGAASVNILHAIGIHSKSELSSIGAVGAYIRIKQRGIHVSKVMLYALQGALLDTHWNDLTPELKDKLVTEAEEQITVEDQPHRN